MRECPFNNQALVIGSLISAFKTKVYIFLTANYYSKALSRIKQTIIEIKEDTK